LNSSPKLSATGAILRSSATAAACTELSWKVDTLSDCNVIEFGAGPCIFRPESVGRAALLLADLHVSPHKATNQGRFGRFERRSWPCAAKRGVCRRELVPMP
jgi:hypothetical protein